MNLLFGFPALSLFAENPQPEHHLGGKSQSAAATVFPGIRILIFGGKALVVRGFSPETGIGILIMGIRGGATEAAGELAYLR